MFIFLVWMGTYDKYLDKVVCFPIWQVTEQINRFTNQEGIAMEFTKIEELAIKKSLERNDEQQVTELTELQLAFVGGGVGEVGLN